MRGNEWSWDKADWVQLRGPVALERGAHGWDMIHCAYCGMHKAMPTEFERAVVVAFHGSGSCTRKGVYEK